MGGRRRNVKPYDPKLLRKILDWTVPRKPSKQRKPRPSTKGIALYGDRAPRYGMSKSEFRAMLREQKNRCAICDKEFGPAQLPHIDHDHQIEHLTNSVRGLLCRHCNHGLGSFYDQIRILKRAIHYLDNWRQQVVIRSHRENRPDIAKALNRLI